MNAQQKRKTRQELAGILAEASHPQGATLVAGLVAAAIIPFGMLITRFPVDAGIVSAWNASHVGVWGAVADGIYRGLEPVFALMFATALVGVVGFATRSIRAAVAFGGVIALTWLPVVVLKVVVDRPRPLASTLAHVFVPAQSDGSFPSGHTAFVTVVIVATWYLVRGTHWAVPVVGAGVVVILVVGAAVVSDGLHYPTDVLASVGWSLAVAPAMRLWLAAVLRPRARTVPAVQAGVPRR